MEGVGINNMWGFTPAIDLVNTYLGAREAQPETDLSGDRNKEINLLCIGPGDIRHALKTFAQARRHTIVDKITIHLCESPAELLARDLLLLQVATDWEVPIRTRANTFLEIFGNSLVQRRTSDYIATLSRKLIQFIREEKGSLKRLVDISGLKHRDVDALEEVFLSWAKDTRFNMKELREMRLREYYGQKYDNRRGSIDWDYQALKARASIIHAKQFQEWRESGIGFEFGDQAYTEANKTMASYAETREAGQRKLRKGFWGDIRIGPFLSFGIACETPNEIAKSLFKVVGKGGPTEQHRHTAVHIAVYNILSYLHEVETSEVYQMQTENDVYSGLGYNERFSRDKKNSDNATDRRLEFAQSIADNVMGLKDKVQIKLIRSDNWKATLSKKLAKKKYDLIWVGNAHAQHVDNDLVSCLQKRTGVMVVESAKYMPSLKAEQVSRFEAAIHSRAKTAGLAPLERPKEDACLLFKPVPAATQ